MFLILSAWMVPMQPSKRRQDTSGLKENPPKRVRRVMFVGLSAMRLCST